MTRTVALVCVDPWLAQRHQGDAAFQPFDYAARKVLAALLSGPHAADVDARLVEGGPQDLARIERELEELDPDMIGFSAYVWSFEAFLQMAERLKASRPDRLIVMGGPSARPILFDLPPFRGRQRHIDALALDEGETVIGRLAALTDNSPRALGQIPGLALPANGGWHTTGPADRAGRLDDYPSVYELGLMPPRSTAILETFRGCPLHCAFCEWGTPEQNSRALSVEHTRRELQAMRDHGATNVWFVSAGLNLNPVAFRNLVAAEDEVGFLAEVPFHAEVYPSLMTEEHYRFLERVRADHIGIGLQSLHPDALRLMKRPFDEKRFVQTVERLQAFPATTVEIILGLPGDTPESFAYTLERVLQLPCTARIFKCLVLPDGLMSRCPPGIDLDFDPHTLELRSCTGWPREELDRIEADLYARFPGLEDGPNWFIPHPDARAAGGMGTLTWDPAPRLPAETVAALERGLGSATADAWTLLDVRFRGGTVRLTIDSGAGEIDVVVEAAGAEARFYRLIDGCAYSHGGAALAGNSRALLDASIASMHPILAPLVAAG